ncbi:hypothetical protein KHS38_11980 [Mucilaginibacter sp. Bleaf8]|uniref:hypothetical protein n=1 Tax=Mucilaginibacter sp. Bleaf8 TaxID=2834430 RepID=UPI001BCBAA3C|nr:hypothetical protein [Mucilaginibacter sp. Bleaf8]MBS7565124.1 hypothetical protein [Mucilaginibacter sp. Bleaf8]
MKRYLFFAVWLLPFAGIGQTKPGRLIQLMSKQNTPISKKYDSLGSLDGKVKLDIIRATDMTTDSIWGGLQFQVERGDQAIINIIDKAEIQLFIKTLLKLKDDTEIRQHGKVRITSSNRFQFNVTENNLLHLWNYQIVIDTFYPDSDFNFGKEGLVEILDKLDKASKALTSTN